MRATTLRLFVAALATTALFAAVATANAQVPSRDSVVASGTADPFLNIEASLSSGPSGENPTGSGGLLHCIHQRAGG